MLLHKRDFLIKVNMYQLKLLKGIFAYSWKDFFEYRAYLLFWIVLESLGFFVMYFLWVYIYKSNDLVAGFTLSAMVTNYFAVYVVKQLSASYFDWNVVKKIRTGEFSQFLYRPLSHLSYYLYKNLGEKSIRIILSMPVFFIMGYFLREYLVLPQNLGYLFVSVIIALVINNWLNMLVSYVAFWTESGETFIYLKDSLIYYLSGAMIPLALFGENLSFILKLTPFRYLVSFPAEIYLNRVNRQEIILGLAISFIWLVVLVILERVIYRLGIKKFTAVGN